MDRRGVGVEGGIYGGLGRGGLGRGEVGGRGGWGKNWVERDKGF